MSPDDLQELEERWWQLAEPVLGRLNAAAGDWNALPGREQEIAALWKLLADIPNGGFMQFFCNWGYARYLHALRGLERIGAGQALACLQAQYAVIEHLGESPEVQDYWDLLRLLDDVACERLGAGDRAFDRCAEATLRLALAYYA